jgi:hypothetical protein
LSPDIGRNKRRPPEGAERNGSPRHSRPHLSFAVFEFSSVFELNTEVRTSPFSNESRFDGDQNLFKQPRTRATMAARESEIGLERKGATHTAWLPRQSAHRSYCSRESFVDVTHLRAFDAGQ